MGQGLGCGIQDLGCGVWRLEDPGIGSMVLGLAFLWASGIGFMV